MGHEFRFFEVFKGIWRPLITYDTETPFGRRIQIQTDGCFGIEHLSGFGLFSPSKGCPIDSSPSCFRLPVHTKSPFRIFSSFTLLPPPAPATSSIYLFRPAITVAEARQHTSLTATYMRRSWGRRGYQGGHTTGNDDNQQQDDDADDDPDPHLHVLPPHLLAHAVGAASEALGGLVQVLGFVLELVDVLAALGDGFEVLFHHVDCVVDLLGGRGKDVS